MPFPLSPLDLTKALVAIDSRNPSLVPNGPGEREAAQFLANVLEEWGFAVTLTEVEPGRANVLARIGPRGVAPLVLFIGPGGREVAPRLSGYMADFYTAYLDERMATALRASRN